MKNWLKFCPPTSEKITCSIHNDLFVAVSSGHLCFVDGSEISHIPPTESTEIHGTSLKAAASKTAREGGALGLGATTWRMGSHLVNGYTITMVILVVPQELGWVIPPSKWAKWFVHGGLLVVTFYNETNPHFQ